MKSKIITCLAMLITGLPLMAQENEITVTGKVTDQTGLPVIGASIIESGTQNGAITDLDGNYTLEVEEGATLTVSSIGFKDSQITVTAGQTVYNVTLAEDRELLDEVVVVGYEERPFRSLCLCQRKSPQRIHYFIP